MNIYEGGYIYNNISNRYIASAENEMCLNSLLSLNNNMLARYFKGISVIPAFRVFVLNHDESISYEISRDVISVNLNITYQSGQRRSASLTLANESGHWKYGARKTLWHGMRFRIDCGVLIDKTIYWQPQGVFLLQDASPITNPNQKIVNLSLCDKWGLWDGNVFGNTQFQTIVPQGTPMRQVFDTIIHEDDGTGKMWDVKPIRFNSRYWNTNTYYTIKQNAGQSKAEILLKMASTISSDIYYDTCGYMTLKSNVLECINNNNSVVWRFSEGDRDCSAPTLKYNRSKYYNKIITKGNVVNGYQFSAFVENTNMKSMYNIIDTPINVKVNNDTHLFSDMLCLEQCMYDMVNQSRGLRSVSMTVGYLPFLDVDMAVYLRFPSVDIEGTYIIDSISYELGTVCTMNLNLTSVNEVVF